MADTPVDNPPPLTFGSLAQGAGHDEFDSRSLWCLIAALIAHFNLEDVPVGDASEVAVRIRDAYERQLQRIAKHYGVPYAGPEVPSADHQ